MLNDFIYRLRALFARQSVERELEEELQYHLQREAEKYRKAGAEPEEAMRRARLAIGGPEQVGQRCREARGTKLIDDLLQDLRYGLRTLSKSPGFTIVTVLTLALGIGACTAIFSVVNAVLIRSLPYGDAKQLVYLFTPIPRLKVPADSMTPSNADFFDLKKKTHSFSAMTDFDQSVYTVTTEGGNTQLGAGRVDEDFFSTLQALPELGRTIDANDNNPGHDSVAIISHGLWQSMFAGSMDVLTKSLQLDGRSYRIIGVMPANFQYPHVTDIPYLDPRIPATQLWIPLGLSPQQKANRDDSAGWAIARLKQGVPVEQAQADVRAIMVRLDLLHDPFTRGSQAFLKPFLEISVGPVRPLMWILLGAVSMVLVIACGNAANLLLARAAGRTHELGMRAALGAGRGRIIRQMLTESLLLGLAGGSTGIALASLLLHLLLRMNPGNIPRLADASLDSRVLLFCMALSILTSLVFGSLPALAAARLNLAEFLKSGGSRGTVGSHTRLHDGLIVAEIGLVVILLAGAGLLLRSYVNVMAVDTGFAQSTVSLRIDLNDRYKPQQRTLFFEDLIAKIGSLRGVQAVGAIDGLPLTPFENFTIVWVDGYANRKDQLVSVFGATSSHYFSAMNTPLIQGRFFTDDESTGGNQPVIVNQAFADTYFAGRNPIGRQISLHFPHPSPYTVVGVVANQRSKLEESAVPQVYHPFSGEPTAYIAIRSVLPPREVAAGVRAILRTADPNLVFSDFHTMGELVSEAAARRRFQMNLLTAFALMALLLGMVGIYGLLAYSVKQRTAEIGLRIALGASRGHVLRMILRQGLLLTLFGLLLGLSGALALTRVLTSSLFGVSALDPITFAAVPALLLLVTIAACLVPARRAAKVDPMRTLRYE
jgi:predicted permease